VSIKLIDGPTEIGLVRAGDQFTIHGRPGVQVSLIPAGQTVRGVTLDGFEYPLRDQDIEAGSTLGISNILRQPRATIEIGAGRLFYVLTDPGGSD
jgi:thiamine pyrophosphokinase